MSKKIIRNRVELNDLDCKTLKELQEMISQWIDKYGDNSFLDVDVDTGYAEYSLVFHREETDEEYNKRIKTELELETEKRNAQIKHIENMANKYGKTLVDKKDLDI